MPLNNEHNRTDTMCGIVGLYLKNPDIRNRLGAYFSPMLEQMTDRGPDSAGVAIYRGAVAGEAKVTLYDPDSHFDWDGVAVAAERDLDVAVAAERISSHAILRAAIDATALRRWDWRGSGSPISRLLDSCPSSTRGPSAISFSPSSARLCSGR